MKKSQTYTKYRIIEKNTNWLYYIGFILVHIVLGKRHYLFKQKEKLLKGPLYWWKSISPENTRNKEQSPCISIPYMYLYKKLYVTLSSIHKENKNIKVKTPKQSCSAPYPYKILGMSAEFSCFLKLEFFLFVWLK